VIHDRAGAGLPLDLTIADASAVRWDERGLTLERPVLIASAAAAAKVVDATYATDEVALELWVRSGAEGSAVLGTMLALMEQGERGNFSVSQLAGGGNDRERYRIGLLVSDAGTERFRKLHTARYAEYGRLVQIVVTRDALGVARVYLDGELQSSAQLSGSLARWDEQLRLAIGGDLAGSAPWTGTFRELAISNRALSPAEVAAHYQQGGAVAPGAR
jgi:hypothetical protein